MQLRTEIEIHAPPEAVWETLLDVSSYHEWNPLIPSLEGELQPGSRLSVVICPPQSSDLRFSPTVVDRIECQRLSWRGKMFAEWWLLGEHYFQLRPTPSGTTRFVHGEDFSGLFVRFLKPQLTATARGFVFMNQALKRRVESERG